MDMRYIEAPHYDPDPHPPSLFLAGGITSCPDWQQDMLFLLGMDGTHELTLYNPRRNNFPIEDADAAYEQIKWEYDHLRLASMRLFWFPEESICPIALFELGASMQKPSLFIGCHPNYPRRQDVIIQTSLAREGLPIYDSVTGLAQAVREYLG